MHGCNALKLLWNIVGGTFVSQWEVRDNVDLKEIGRTWWELKHFLPPLGLGWWEHFFPPLELQLGASGWVPEHFLSPLGAARNHPVFPLWTFFSTASFSGMAAISFHSCTVLIFTFIIFSICQGVFQMARCDGSPLVEKPHDLGKKTKLQMQQVSGELISLLKVSVNHTSREVHLGKNKV